MKLQALPAVVICALSFQKGAAHFNSASLSNNEVQMTEIKRHQKSLNLMRRVDGPFDVEVVKGQTCTGYSHCGPGHRLKLLPGTKHCAADPCTDSEGDRGACCRKVATCDTAAAVCVDGYKLKENPADHNCEAEKCGAQDLGHCCVLEKQVEIKTEPYGDTTAGGEQGDQKLKENLPYEHPDWNLAADCRMPADKVCRFGAIRTNNTCSCPVLVMQDMRCNPNAKWFPPKGEGSQNVLGIVNSFHECVALATNSEAHFFAYGKGTNVGECIREDQCPYGEQLDANCFPSFNCFGKACCPSGAKAGEWDLFQIKHVATSDI